MNCYLINCITFFVCVSISDADRNVADATTQHQLQKNICCELRLINCGVARFCYKFSDDVVLVFLCYVTIYRHRIYLTIVDGLMLLLYT